MMQNEFKEAQAEPHLQKLTDPQYFFNVTMNKLALAQLVQERPWVHFLSYSV